MKKALLTIAIILLLLALIGTALYNFVSPFRDIANTTLGALPGPIGERFSKLPTAAETEQQVERVANYLLSLPDERIIDKLLAIKAEDEAIYQDVIKIMLRAEPRRAERVLENIRQSDLEDNILLSELQKIDDELSESNKEHAQFILSLNRVSAIADIKTILDEEVDGTAKVAAIFEHLPDDVVVDIVKHLRADDVNAIYQNMPQKRVLLIKELIEKGNLSVRVLKQTATLLATKKPIELVDVLGNEDTYNMKQLATIYQELGPVIGGAVLSKIRDDAFTTKLTNAIVDSQMLEKNDDFFSDDLLKSLNIFREYDDNLSELAKVYKEADESKIADIIKRLYWNSENVKVFTLKNGEHIELSDKQLAIDLLKSFTPKKIAAILSYLDNSISTEISTELVLPDLK